MSDTRVYGANDWMVRRWDAINGGKQVTPKSFCQFWRTVLLWGTLSKIPFVGKLFLTQTWEFPDRDFHEEYVKERERREKRRIAWETGKTRKVVRAIGRVIAFVTLPVRFVLSKLFRGLVTVVAAIDGFADRHREGVEKTALVGGIIIFTVGLGLAATLIVFLLIELFTSDVSWLWIFAIGGNVLSILVSAAVLREKILDIIFSVLYNVGQVVVTIWRALVDAKHYVCPPMEIEGRG